MKRGDIITVVVQGDYGKPRPAVVIQSDLLTEAGAHSVILCLITSKIEAVRTFRMKLQPSSTNGLQKPSQIMVDKILTIPQSKVGNIIGALTKEQQQALTRMLAVVIGLV